MLQCRLTPSLTVTQLCRPQVRQSGPPAHTVLQGTAAQACAFRSAQELQCGDHMLQCGEAGPVSPELTVRGQGMRHEMSVTGSHGPGCSEAASQGPLLTRHVFLSAEPRGPWLVIPQLQERPSAFRPAHKAVCLTPPRPSSRCGGGPQSSLADRELGRRGTGPSFLLLRASGGFAACMSPGRQGSQDWSAWQGP